MSIINKMLRDLDRRNAVPGRSVGPAESSPVRAIPTRPARVGSELFWWAVSLVLVAAIAWLGWVMWQLTPRSLVNELALRSSVKALAAPEAVAGIGGDLPPQGTELMDAASRTHLIKLDMLKLATEITTPIPKRPVRVEPTPHAVAAKEAISAVPKSAENSTARSIAGKDASEAARIDKHVFISPRERAELEYGQAIGLINRGRLAEGMERLRGALNVHGSYEPARQALVALLLEQRRPDEAAVLLQRGLEIDPSNTAAAMLLARVMVDRQDVPGALALLRKYAPPGGGGADYHAFVAALQQRLGHHDEAVVAYQLALKPSPQVGAWWLGLGISQEAAGRKRDAADAYRRARSSGALAPELVDYIDQRLQQLQ